MFFSTSATDTRRCFFHVWKRNSFVFSCIEAVFLFIRITMKSEIVVELLKIMFRKFIKTKIIVCQNVNFMFNLLNSYDGSRRRRDRSKRSHFRQSPEIDSKQQRRHRKPHHNGEAVREKVSQRNCFYFFTPIKRKTHLWCEIEKKKVLK